MSTDLDSVRLVRKVLALYAREIGEDASDTEPVMTDFLVSMRALATRQGLDFDALVETARDQSPDI